MNTQTYKTPNLNAPRQREKVNDFLSYPDKDTHGFFARLKTAHPEMAKYSNRGIAKMIELCNKALAAEVVSDGWNGVELPEKLGIVIVSACRVSDETENRNIDFHRSNQMGKVIRHYNWHSEHILAKIIYYNNIPYHRFKNHHLWKFKPCRQLQRAVSADFKNGRYNCYKSYSKKNPISRRYHKMKIKKEPYEGSQQQRDDFMKTYDEFAFD